MPIYGIMAVDVVTAAFAITPLLFIPIRQPPRAAQGAGQAGPSPTLWAGMRQGLIYVWRWPGLKAIVVRSLVLSLVGMAMILCRDAQLAGPAPEAATAVPGCPRRSIHLAARRG